MPEGMTFSAALEELKAGKTVTRAGWAKSELNIRVRAQYPDEHSANIRPYLYMIKGEDRFPLDLSCESIFSDDWVLVEETE
jgi:hypothetical protein